MTTGTVSPFSKNILISPLIKNNKIIRLKNHRELANKATNDTSRVMDLEIMDFYILCTGKILNSLEQVLQCKINAICRFVLILFFSPLVFVTLPCHNFELLRSTLSFASAREIKIPGAKSCVFRFHSFHFPSSLNF